MRDKPLFVYGTLRDNDIFRRVTGKGLDSFEVEAGVARGYRAVYALGQNFPILTKKPMLQPKGFSFMGWAMRSGKSSTGSRGANTGLRPSLSW